MTQDAKHTPGPWRLERDRAFSLSVYGSDNFFVGEVTHEADESNATENANARLIAAAPKLLEVLEIIASGGVGQFQWSMTKAESLARAAIAEAKGLAV